MRTQELELQLTADIAEQLLKSGAEIFRVEESCLRMLKVYGIQKSNVYIISNGIFISAKDEEEHSISEVRHVPLGSMHLERVAALNQLVRDICDELCDYEEAVKRLAEIRRIPDNSWQVNFIFSLIGIGAFTYLFRGTVIDVFFSIIIGCVEMTFLTLTRNGRMAALVRVVFASTFIAITASIIAQMGMPVQKDIMIIGSIMPLVPGVAFNTSVREFYRGDYLSGTIHLLDTLVTALCIAVGIYLPMAIVEQLGGVIR